MKKDLWTVFADHLPVAVVAATCATDAWRIVAALDDHDDLPKRRRGTEIAPCPPSETNRIQRQARKLGVSNEFLACLRGGMFLTSIGGAMGETPSEQFA